MFAWKAEQMRRRIAQKRKVLRVKKLPADTAGQHPDQKHFGRRPAVRNRSAEEIYQYNKRMAKRADKENGFV